MSEYQNGKDVNQSQIIDFYINGLFDENLEVRAKSAKELAKFGEFVVKPLVNLINQSSSAIECLILIGNSAVEPLVEALGDDTRADFAFDALVGIGEASAKSVIKALKSESADKRSWATLFFSLIKNSTAVPLLINLLKDDDEATRINAINAIIFNESVELAKSELQTIAENDENSYIANLAHTALQMTQ